MWSQWYLVNEKNTGGTSIKRYEKVDGKTKWQRYPAKEYRGLPRDQVESLVRRLNATYEIKRKEAEERYNFDHAFINIKVMERYKEFLESNANDKHHIQTMLHYLNAYALEYFVIKENLPDPKFWKAIDDKWGAWLVKTAKLSYNTIQQVVFNTNRFLSFLHERVYPNEVPFIKLRPLSKNRLKLIKLETVSARYKFISEEKFAIMASDLENLPKLSYLKSPLFLCYHFGLRINESFGCIVDDVFTDELEVVRQGMAFKNGKIVTKPLKNLEKRAVPYWFANADQAYEWISSIKHCSPGVMNKDMNKFLSNYGHESHDLRRSFVTRSLRKYHWREVMLAAGHKDMETTLRYDIPLEKEQRKKFVPKTS